MAESFPNIAYLTAGAAGMFCGSCMRDNTLAAALSKMGCEIHLIPTYTPIRTDEENVSEKTLFFGGINVYLQQKIPLFRHLPAFLDRPLDNPWLVRKLSQMAIDTDAGDLGEMTLSVLRGEDGFQRKEVRRLIRWLKREIKPDLVNLSNLLIAGSVPALKRELNVPIVVTLQGDDLFIEGLSPSFRRRALEHLRKLAQQVDGFIVFSRYYADFMSSYLSIPKERIHIVPLGLNLTDFARYRPASSNGNPLTLGYFARICPEKGFHLLVDAFLDLKSRPATRKIRMRAAGWLGDKDREYFEQQVRRIENAGLGEHFEYAGELERGEKLAFLHGLDVLSVPTTYRDPKGIFVLEAMAAGVAVVQPAHGAFPELLEATGGGLSVRPDDAAHLADTLYGLLTDDRSRSQLALRGRASVHADFSAEAMAHRTLQVYENFLPASRRRSA